MQTAAPIRDYGNASDDTYQRFIERMGDSLRRRLGDKEPLLRTDVDLWPVYLGTFADEAERQYHNCSACRHFMQRYGGLANVGSDGELVPALWGEEDTPTEYAEVSRRLRRAVSGAKVVGVFMAKDAVLGEPGTGTSWLHYAILVPKHIVWTGLTKTAGQAMAEKREDYVNVSRALSEFSPEVIAQALSLLRSEALYRSEKVIGPVEWLADLHEACAKAGRGQRRANVIWRAVAAAPAGFCHPRSSMAGTLLEDLNAGRGLEDVRRRFAAKMHPLQYQRPQAPPSTGSIERAEKIVEQLGIARALERRFAKIEECKLLWSPPAPSAPSGGGGVFDHLRNPGRAPTGAADGGTMTWEKFATKVLPGAQAISVVVPSNGDFIALVTAVHADAPPILQWDREGERNPVSWYRYSGGSAASQWGLRGGAEVPVTGVTLQPSMWTSDLDHHGKGAVFLLAGCREVNGSEGLALFPETLKSELREVRSVIEAHSRSRRVQGAEAATACGLGFKGAVVNVTDKTGVTIRYQIDRWD